jgi:O-antigen ligase
MAGAISAAVFVWARWSIALAGAVMVLVLSAWESEPFLLAIIFLIPFGWSMGSRESQHDVASAIHALVVAGFFLGRFWSGRVEVQRLLRSSPARASLILLGAILVSILFGRSGWTQYSAHSLYAMVTYVGFFFLVLAWANSPERLRKILRVLLYSTIMTAVFAVFQEIVGGYTSFWLYLNPQEENPSGWGGRATSFLNYSNSLAGYLNLILPFALACYVLGLGNWKKLGKWTLGLGSLALLSTQSVGALVAFVAILVLAIFYFARNRMKSLVLLVSICAFVGLFYLLKQYLNPTHTAENIGPDTVIRMLLWGTAWGYFVHSPITGVGWGNFVGLYGSDLSSFSSIIPSGVFEVHNIYLQLLAETGLVGFVAFFYLVVKCWQQAWNQMRSSPDFLSSALAFGVLGALVSVMVHGFVDFLFQVSPQFGTLFWVLLGLLAASGRLRRNSLAEQSHSGHVGRLP